MVVLDRCDVGVTKYKKGKVAFPSLFWSSKPDEASKTLPASPSLCSSRSLGSGCTSRSGCSRRSSRSFCSRLGLFSLRTSRTSRTSRAFLPCWSCWSCWPCLGRWSRWRRWRGSRILLASHKSESPNKKGYTRPHNEFIFHSNLPPSPIAQANSTLEYGSLPSVLSDSEYCPISGGIAV